jgi:hypothetical protein
MRRRSVWSNADLGRAGHALQERDGLGVIDAPDFVLVPEVLDRAPMAEELETGPVEREFRSRGPEIVDGRRVPLDLNIGQRDASRRFVGIGNELLARGRNIIQGRLDVRQRGDCDLDHCDGSGP